MMLFEFWRIQKKMGPTSASYGNPDLRKLSKNTDKFFSDNNFSFSIFCASRFCNLPYRVFIVRDFTV